MEVPRDIKGNVIKPDLNEYAVQLTPGTSSLQVTKNDAVSTSTLVADTLHTSTTIIRVVSLDNGVFLKYTADSVTSTVFDEYVPAGYVMDFIKPDGCTAISVIADEGTARVRIIEK
jgi:endoglucanase Acf2